MMNPDAQLLIGIIFTILVVIVYKIQKKHPIEKQDRKLYFNSVVAPYVGFILGILFIIIAINRIINQS